jgi:hypothetical protein
MSRLIDRHPLLWGYSVEVILSTLIWIIIERVWGQPSIASFIFARKADIFFTVGSAAATCGLFFAAFVAFMCTDFGRKMRRAGAAVEYLVGFIMPFIAFAITIACLHFVSSSSTSKSSGLSLFLLIYCAINCITMLKNFIGITRIWQDIDRLKYNVTNDEP